MKGCRRNHSLFRQQGVGLIEVLVALLVISIGVLGMAGLQSKSLQHNNVAYLRSQAFLLANDMMDRIRANRAMASSGSGYTVGEEDYLAGSCTEENYPDTCEAASCTAEQMVEYDIRQWKFQMVCQLPDADGTIAIENTGSGPVYVIRMEFDESRGAEAAREVVLRGAL